MGSWDDDDDDDGVKVGSLRVEAEEGVMFSCGGVVVMVVVVEDRGKGVSKGAGGLGGVRLKVELQMGK